MDAATERAFNGMKQKLSEAEAKAAYYEGQVGEMRMKWIAVKDQYEGHMAQPHAPVIHAPAVAPVRIEGAWGVYCIACTAGSSEFVYPCKADFGQDDFPPPMLLIPPNPEAPDA